MISLTLADLANSYDYKKQCKNYIKCKKKNILNADFLEKLGYNEYSAIIDLRYHCIESIHPDTFKNFKRVIKIDLSFNYLTKVVSPVFDGLIYLEQLLVNNNQLTIIGPNVFDYLTGLKLINLNSNKLTVLNSTILNPMVNLVELYAARNLIEDCGWDEQILLKLRKFDVHSNRIKRISKCTQFGVESEGVVCNVPSAPRVNDYDFVYFDISNNLLTEITQFDLYCVGRLVYFNAAHNRINKLDLNAFSYNGALESLDLEHNYLKEIPPFKCICNIYDCVDNCSRDSILGCDFQLRYLNLASNELQRVTRHDFEYLNRLEILFLAYNEVISIEQNSFVNNWNMRKLRLEHNDLKVIEENTFTGLWSLKSLDLSWNRIVKIAKCAFKDLHQIEVICLNHNPISSKKNIKSLCNSENNRLCAIKTTEPCNCYE